MNFIPSITTSVQNLFRQNRDEAVSRNSAVKWSMHLLLWGVRLLTL